MGSLVRECRSEHPRDELRKLFSAQHKNRVHKFVNFWWCCEQSDRLHFDQSKGPLPRLARFVRIIHSLRSLDKENWALLKLTGLLMFCCKEITFRENYFFQQCSSTDTFHTNKQGSCIWFSTNAKKTTQGKQPTMGWGRGIQVISKIKFCITAKH